MGGEFELRGGDRGGYDVKFYIVEAMNWLISLVFPLPYNHITSILITIHI